MDALVEAAARELAARRARDAVFGADRDGFGEPAWDMLLALFAEQIGACGMTKTAAIAASAVPVTTAELYVTWLVSRGFATEAGARVQISDRGRGLMTAYLEGQIHDR